MTISMGARLEEYTMKCPKEVLLVSIEVQGEPDQVAIFKGFSSSLMCPTAFDPDIPMIPDGARIVSIDRLEGPYNPNSPRYIEQGLTLASFEKLLTQVGV